jgi:hypothetical protein
VLFDLVGQGFSLAYLENATLKGCPTFCYPPHRWGRIEKMVKNQMIITLPFAPPIKGEEVLRKVELLEFIRR